MSRWKTSKQITKEASKTLSKYPPIVRQLLFNRGIETKNEAEEFFEEKDFEFQDPFDIYDAKTAAKAILKAVEDGKKIFIHGDFDVDGICATSILWDFLYRKLEADIIPYVPSRFEEGYGMSDKSLKALKNEGAELVITVDCGIKDVELIKKWKKRGLEFIVTDHHELRVIEQIEADKTDETDETNKTNEADGYQLPDAALAIVHPQHPKSKCKFKEIAGATVAWKLVEAIAEIADLKIDTDEYLDLVALATVCDVMPLKGENRLIVKKGLEQIHKTKRKGLKRLIYDAGLEPEDIEAYHLGFIIGPRLNAAGRLEHAIDAIRLLVTDSFKQAAEISEKLNDLNTKRQGIQKKIYEEAVIQVENQGVENKLYFVWGEEWEEGVIGIVAGKICETYNRPVLIATRKGEIYTGSARSISEFNIIKAINSQSDLLDRFGGHPQAAGFTVSPESIENFRENLLEIADSELDDDDVVREYSVDAEIQIGDINWDLLEEIEKFAPFGFGNPKPKFVVKNVKLDRIKAVGSDGDHLQIGIADEETGEYIRGIGFNLGKKVQETEVGDKVDLLFTLEENVWNGRSNLQMNVKDIRM